MRVERSITTMMFGCTTDNKIQAPNIGRMERDQPHELKLRGRYAHGALRFRDGIRTSGDVQSWPRMTIGKAMFARNFP